jgi:hypothetical protein
VSRRGRYKVNLPPGKWALRTSVVAMGQPFASFTSAAIVTRAGQRRSLPLTLKRFKKPRKRVRRRKRGRKPPSARVANVNPRDGRSYPGEAYGVEKFTVASGNADLRVLGTGLSDMLITDLMAKKCPFTIVEWTRRAAIVAEIALSQTEHVDPASRVEAGHLIDPEILIRGRVEDRPGTPKRIALIAWLVDAKTGARLSPDVSSVSIEDAFFASAGRLSELVMRDLICARANAVPPRPPGPPAAPGVSAPSAPAQLPPPPPSPPVPTAATDTYTGSFSGEAYSEAASLRWTWNGTARFDAAQDQGPAAPPLNGAPTGSYRIFTVTSGSVDVTMEADPPSGCALDGSGHFELQPGFLSQIIVQLDVPDPAYAITINGVGNELVQVTKSGGESCTGTSLFPAFSHWASTGLLAHTSPSFSLVGSQSELTPAVPFDYDYTTRWSFAPG